MRQAADKFRLSAKLAADAGIIPYKSETGAWVTSPYDGNSWWTGGFWPGLMWQLHCATGDEQFQTEARRVEKLLTDEFRTFRCLNHDVGFMYLLSCGADAKLTGDEQAKTDTLHAASLLMGRFNPAGFIRAWNHPDQRGFARAYPARGQPGRSQNARVDGRRHHQPRGRRRDGRPDTGGRADKIAGR